MEITPSTRNQLLQDLFGGGFCALALGGVVYCNQRSASIAAGVGLVFAVITAAITHVRFRLFAPRQITADDEGLCIIPRRGSVVGILWEEVKKASHSTMLGRKWILKLSAGRVVIRDDGIDGPDWQAFSALLCQELGKRRIPMRVDLYYKFTVEKE